MTENGTFTWSEPQGARDRRALAALFARTFAGDDPGYEQFVDRFHDDSVRLLRSSRRLEGGMVYYRMGQWFGGRSVPAVGLAGVAVPPESRGRGTGLQLVRCALEELASEEVALCPLYPATQPLYARLGWQLAGTRQSGELALPFPPPKPEKEEEIVLRPLEDDDRELLHEVYGRRAAAQQGNLDRSRQIWARVRTPGGENTDLCGYAAEVSGRAEGYILYVQTREEGSFRYRIRVRDLVFLSREAGAALVRLLFNHRSVADRVVLETAPFDPLFELLPEQSCKPTGRFDWMLRVVDLRRALEARGYPEGLSAKLEIDVADEALPQNAGRWTLTVENGRGEIARGGSGELRLDVRGLAGLYSSRYSATQLAMLGLASGDARVLRLADALLAGAAPWMPDFF